VKKKRAERATPENAEDRAVRLKRKEGRGSKSWSRKIGTTPGNARGQTKMQTKVLIRTDRDPSHWDGGV